MKKTKKLDDNEILLKMEKLGEEFKEIHEETIRYYEKLEKNV